MSIRSIIRTRCDRVRKYIYIIYEHEISLLKITIFTILPTLRPLAAHGVWCPAAGQNLENWTTVPSLYSWNIAECDVKPQTTMQTNSTTRNTLFMKYTSIMLRWDKFCGPAINRVSRRQWTPTAINCVTVNLANEARGYVILHKRSLIRVQTDSLLFTSPAKIDVDLWHKFSHWYYKYNICRFRGRVAEFLPPPLWSKMFNENCHFGHF